MQHKPELLSRTIRASAYNEMELAWSESEK